MNIILYIRLKCSLAYSALHSVVFWSLHILLCRALHPVVSVLPHLHKYFTCLRSFVLSLYSLLLGGADPSGRAVQISDGRCRNLISAPLDGYNNTQKN